MQFQGGNWSFVNFRGVIDYLLDEEGMLCLFDKNLGEVGIYFKRNVN